MPERVPTVADLCSALAEGEISATFDGSAYHVNALELRRYLNRFRPLPTISREAPPLPARYSLDECCLSGRVSGVQ